MHNQKELRKENSMKARLGLLILLLTLVSGCTYFREHFSNVKKQKEKTEKAIANESKVMVTGALDALQVAPTNPPVNLARNQIGRAHV